MFEIGTSLREARARRSIDLAQAEQATKIRARYLRALEDERFEQLPSPTYVKGFLRTYADYLGLDGQLYVDEFNSRFVAGEDHGDRPRRSSVRPERRTRRLETYVVILVVSVVSIVTLVVVSAWQTSGSGSKAPKVHKRVHRVVHHSVPRPPVAYLQIEAVKGSSYVTVHRVGATGKPLFQGTIEKGRTEPFKGKYFWIAVSSPENIRIVVAGRPVAVHGSTPITLTVTPGGVQQS